MAKGRKTGTRNIDSRLEQTILVLKVNNHDWSAERIRRYLVALKESAAKERGPKGYLVNVQIPKARAIQKVIKEHRDGLNKLSFEDAQQPWSLGDTVKYSIPGEAIPHVLAIQKRNSLTVREALWVSRLYAVKGLENPASLWRAVALYSMLEIGAALAGVKKLNTSDWDESLKNETLDEDILDGFVPPVTRGDFSGYKPGTFEIGGELKP